MKNSHIGGTHVDVYPSLDKLHVLRTSEHLFSLYSVAIHTVGMIRTLRISNVASFENQNGLEVKMSRAYTSHNLPKKRLPNSESAVSRSAMVGASTRKVVSCFRKSNM
jgi:hypothetical protein